MWTASSCVRRGENGSFGNTVCVPVLPGLGGPLEYPKCMRGLTHERQLPGPLLGCDDLQRRRDGLNANDGLVGVISSWHSQFQIPAHQKFGGDILQL